MTPDQVHELARQAGVMYCGACGPKVLATTAEGLVRFAELVRAEERERAATACIETINDGNYAYAKACRDCAAAIREGK